jgi:hypothetical protein
VSHRSDRVDSAPGSLRTLPLPTKSVSTSSYGWPVGTLKPTALAERRRRYLANTWICDHEKCASPHVAAMSRCCRFGANRMISMRVLSSCQVSRWLTDCQSTLSSHLADLEHGYIVNTFLVVLYNSRVEENTCISATPHISRWPRERICEALR